MTTVAVGTCQNGHGVLWGPVWHVAAALLVHRVETKLLPRLCDSSLVVEGCGGLWSGLDCLAQRRFDMV